MGLYILKGFLHHSSLNMLSDSADRHPGHLNRANLKTLRRPAHIITRAPPTAKKPGEPDAVDGREGERIWRPKK